MWDTTLDAWKKSHELTLAVYKATASFPTAELYGLTSQMRRAAASIPANIAEGCGRTGDAELTRFLRMAMGSASELEYHLLLSRDLGLIEPDVHTDLEATTVRVKRMLTGLIQRLTAKA